MGVALEQEGAPAMAAAGRVTGTLVAVPRSSMRSSFQRMGLVGADAVGVAVGVGFASAPGEGGGGLRPGLGGVRGGGTGGGGLAAGEGREDGDKRGFGWHGEGRTRCGRRVQLVASGAACHRRWRVGSLTAAARCRSPTATRRGRWTMPCSGRVQSSNSFEAAGARPVRHRRWVRGTLPSAFTVDSFGADARRRGPRRPGKAR